MLSLPSAPFTIAPATGELFDTQGVMGLYVLDPMSGDIDPQGFTYTATVVPNVGSSWSVTFGGNSALPDVVDLVRLASIAPATGVSTLEQRVAALEADTGSGGAPAEHTHTLADVTDYTPTRGLIITDTNVTTIPAGSAVDNLAAYYNSGSAAITVQGTSIAAGSHAVWAWVSGAWTLLASGTGGTPPPDGETITKAPAAPTLNTFEHTLTIPSDTGVTYQLSCTGAVSPVDALAGTWTVTTGTFASVDTGTKTITLTSYPGTVYVGTTAQAGYLLSEPSSWSAEFVETVSPYVAAAPADTQYLFVLDDAPGTTIPANSGTAGTTGVGRNGTMIYGAETSGAGATAVKGNGSADIRLNGVLTSSVTAWTWCAVVTAPCGKGLNLSNTSEDTSPTFQTGFTVFTWSILRDWNNKNSASFQWGTPSVPGVRGAGPTSAANTMNTTRSWAKGDRMFVAATWDGAVFKTWLGDAAGLQLAASVADTGPVTTPATWQILVIETQLTDANAPLRSVGGLIAHVGRAFTQAELEALNNAVVRP